MRFLFVICLLFIAASELASQSSWYPINRQLEKEINRIDIKENIDVNFHSSIKNYYREDVDQLAHLSSYELSNYLKAELSQDTSVNNNQNFWSHFYKRTGQFLSFGDDNFSMVVNPIIHFKGGNDSNDDNFIFQNTRGINIYGSLDKKIYFSTSIYENQSQFLKHINRRISQYKAIPGNGFYKPYESGVFDSVTGWDYLNADGYVGLSISKSVALEFGHGKHFIGDGYHSLLLDNYSHNYFYLKFKTQFWKLQYQNIFAELSVFGSEDNFSNTLLPKKYMAAHYLDFNVTADFSIGLYEAIIFNRENHFEFQYLNPVILYRSVEQFLDSPDNVLLGLNLKWNIHNKIQVYSQVMIDELVIGELTSNEGWWGNKNGFQLGMKFIDIADINTLDAQIEYNRVRPYTYAHQDTITGTNELALASYSHYNQPLAHALGANFSELLFRLTYSPMPKLSSELMILSSKFGDDENGINYGGNILKSYETRRSDFNNSIAQGNMTDILQLRVELSYQLFHNCSIDLDYVYRDQDGQNDSNDLRTNYVGLGLRLNIARQRLDY